MFSIHLHLVWITKYREAALTGEVAVRVRDIIRELCRRHEVIKAYIENQQHEQDDGFRIEGEGPPPVEPPSS